MVHEDNPEMIWGHTVKGTISKIRTKANTINLIKYGARPYSELNKVETDLWKIAEEIDAHVNELFIELERLRKKCEDNKKKHIVVENVAKKFLKKNGMVIAFVKNANCKVVSQI